ncbi:MULTISPECIES: hypothetical protein [Micromonospora]|uniref:hypothetical protein n=1 Tax=Micromonospora TaxID=1873 RepID=UPI003A4DBAED
MNREDALNAANAAVDWTAGEVEHQPRPVKSVYSIRPGEELARWLEDEADRLGTDPGRYLKQLLVDARARAAAAEDPTVTVRLSELHRAIDQAAGLAAA